MQVSDAIDCDDLVALVDALDRLKNKAEQKLSIKKATQASMESESTHTGGANQGIQRSHRIASAPQFASAGSLFVTEHETESESGHEDDMSSSPYEYITIDAPGNVFDGVELFVVHDENQAPVEELHRTEMPQERHSIEQESRSPPLYTTRPVVNGHDKGTGVQPVQVLDGASTAQCHQPGPGSPHHSLINQPDQFFNEAFETSCFSPPHYGARTDVEEATAFPTEQYPIDQDHTESFGNGSRYQAAEDPDYIGNQPGPKSPHQDADIPPINEFNFGDFVRDDSPSPSHSFGAASSSQHRESQTDFEEATADSHEHSCQII
jgi:hypothetical protein